MIQPQKVKARGIMQTDVIFLHTLTPIESVVETFEEYQRAHPAGLCGQGQAAAGSDLELRRGQLSGGESVENPRRCVSEADPSSGMDNAFVVSCKLKF